MAAQQKCLAHLRRHFKKLIQLPGLYNREIGEAFISLIDEAFKNYRWFQDNPQRLTYNDWATQFNALLSL